jgi:hypothetical protein
MITVNELIVDSWSAGRRSPWITVVDLSLFLVLGLWTLLDLLATPIAHVVGHRDPARPRVARVDTPRGEACRAVALLDALRVA